MVSLKLVGCGSGVMAVARGLAVGLEDLRMRRSGLGPLKRSWVTVVEIELRLSCDKRLYMIVAVRL